MTARGGKRAGGSAAGPRGVPYWVAGEETCEHCLRYIYEEDVIEAPSADEEGEPPAEGEDGDGGGGDLLDAIRRSMRAVGADGDDGNGHALAELTKDELHERAAERDVPGRSRMSKDELVRALRRQRAGGRGGGGGRGRG